MSVQMALEKVGPADTHTYVMDDSQILNHAEMVLDTHQL